MSTTPKDSDKPISREVIDEGRAKAFIPYAPIGESLEHVPIHVRPDVLYYLSRMGFLPHALKLYLHVPWIAEHLFKLNNAIMRDERCSLPEVLKYRLGLIASRDNQCAYCTSHHVATLKRRWQCSNEDITKILKLDNPADEREAVAAQFVHQASLDPDGVTDEMRKRLAEHFTPAEVMEIVLVIGFWKMYNTMHKVMDLPLENPVCEYRDWVNVQPDENSSKRKER